MSGRQPGPPEGKEGREMGRNENFIAVISVSSFYDMNGRRGRGKYGGELGKGWLPGKKWRREGGSPINKRGRKDWGARLLLQHTAARRGGREGTQLQEMQVWEGRKERCSCNSGIFSSRKRSFVSCDLDCILRSGRFSLAFIK